MNRDSLLLGGMGALLVAAILAGAWQAAPGSIGDQPWANQVGYVVAALVAGAFYAGAVVLVRRRSVPHGLALVLAVAVACRIVTFATPPMLSTDIFRYVWDGRVQLAGINPYLYVPAAPELAFLRDHGAGWSGIFAHINRVDFATTIYPPVAQAVFALLAATWSSVWGIKAAMLLFDAAAAAAALALLRAARGSPALALIYLWNPLVLWEFDSAGHIDAAATGFIALALLAAVWRRPLWAGLALGAAVLCKLLPAALFPALWRRWDWRTPLACGALIVLGYAAYAGAGWRVLGYLPGYADEEGVGGQGAFLLRLLAAFGPVPAWAPYVYGAFALALLLGLAALIALRAPLPADPAARAAVICRDALILGTATMVVLSPHYPWYFAPLALPAILAPAISVLWLTVAAPLLYLDQWHDQVIWPALIFLPFAVLAVCDLLQVRPTLTALPFRRLG